MRRVERQVLCGAEEKGFEGAVEGVEEEMTRGGVCGDEEGFAVVAEFEFRPVGGWGGGGGGVGESAEVEGCEGGFVVVAEVVEEDGGGAGGGDGEDRGRGVVGC